MKISRNSTEFCRIPEIHFANLVDLEKSEKNEYLDAKIGVDTAENELCKVWMWAPQQRRASFLLGGNGKEEGGRGGGQGQGGGGGGRGKETKGRGGKRGEEAGKGGNEERG